MSQAEDNVVPIASALRDRAEATTNVPAHLRHPTTNAERRRNATRGIAQARQALARRRLREVTDDG